MPLFAAGDEIVKAEFYLPKEARRRGKAETDASRDRDDHGAAGRSSSAPRSRTGPIFMWLVQRVPADTKVKLTLKDGRTATLGMADGRRLVHARSRVRRCRTRS